MNAPIAVFALLVAQLSGTPTPVQPTPSLQALPARVHLGWTTEFAKKLESED